MEPPDSIESIYWVFTHRCNLRCAHCYNFSRPEGPTISRAEADAVLDHLPEHANRYILSGGEPLVELDLLLYLLRRGRARYPEARVSIQTNGDLLDDRTLELLLETGIHHIAIASADQYHPRPDGKFEALRERFERFAMPEVTIGDPGAQSKPRPPGPSFSVWGATPELWLGGIWPRGRAMKYGLAQLHPEQNFCAIWSGAIGFLESGKPAQEIAIQLTSAYPCCPGTVEPLGDLAQESLASMLARHRGDPVWEALNSGDPEAMGTAAGFDREYAARRIRELGSVCLWCDEFFTSRRGGRGAPLPVMGEHEPAGLG